MEAALQRLRAVFNDELDDQLASLAGWIDQLKGDDPHNALANIHRCLHTLKGAARTVGYASFADECHALESAVGPGTDLADNGKRLRAFREATLVWAASLRSPDRIAAGPRSAPPERPTDATLRARADQVAELVGQAETVVALAAGDGAAELEAVQEQLGQLTAALQQVRAGARQAGPVAEVDRAVAAAQALTERLTVAVASARQRQALLGRATVDLFENARRVQIVRMDSLVPALERVAADVSLSRGRPVQFVTDLGVEADRAVCDAIREPLAQLIRNAVDHGIEDEAERRAAGKPALGRVEVRARAVGREVRIEVSDDGRGLDPRQIRKRARVLGIPTTDDDTQVLFSRGFTTRADADGLSGRGVGLDLVRRVAERLGGRTWVEAGELGGARFVLQLPVEAQIVQALLVDIGQARLAIALSKIERVTRTRREDLSMIDRTVCARTPAGLVPVVDLWPDPGRTDASEPLLLVWLEATGRVALLVDGLAGTRELVVRAVGRRLAGCTLVSGAAMLGSTAVPVLDVAAIVAAAGEWTWVPGTLVEARAPHRLLVVDDAATPRTLLKMVLESAGYAVSDASDGVEALDVLARGGISLVVSDLEMPRMDGLQLIARIRANPATAGLPIVVVTGQVSQVARQRASDAGADACLVKGELEPGELLATLQALLR